MVYQNYHKHSYYTQARIADSVASYEDYAKKAIEYGHTILSSVEHGWQGRYIECYELAKKYNLKFLFGVEAYYVKDRKEKDRTNAHLVLLAKNENGRQWINEIISDANIDGFYFQPRIDDELLYKLPANDVWVTTACIGGVWKYEDYEDVVVKMHNYFGNNFFLEVQAHITEEQKELNKKILYLHNRYGIRLIAGADSHYMNEDDSWERDELLQSKGFHYEEEDGWFMDYPSYEEFYSRFIEQGILSEDEIRQSLENTNILLEVEKYENEIFEYNIKMPTIYPNKTKEEKDKIFENIVYAEWEKEKQSIPQTLWDKYEKEIAMEVKVVKDIDHSDYFLIDYATVQDGVQNGGYVTNTGRGSSVSYYINKLLGFTDVDRISSPVKLYPERFLSKTRILETGSIADIDLNLGNPEVFAESQKRVLGDDHAYPMMKYGKFKVKSAWKLFAKSQDVPFDVSTAVTKQIEKYEKALVHADSDEEKENIHVEDYIEDKYLEIFDKSKSYRGIISSASIHPCGYLIYNKSIKRNIGLIKLKDNLCCVMDGKWGEKYKFLKNDLLKVSVVLLIKAVYRRLGIKEHSVRELLDICTPDHKVWGIYKKGYTVGINQVEQSGTSSRCSTYQPTNISELCSFVAAIRPGFKSMYKQYENREDFAYNIKAIDDLIRTEQFPQSYMLYQEQAMAVLHYAGIPMDLTYEIIKNIAKKRADAVMKYKEQFLIGMKDRIINDEHKSEDEANRIADMTWQIMEDSSRYSFNASHSLSVAIDSLYCAFLKAEYPLEFYETYIKIMVDENKKDKIISAQNESMTAFGIKYPPFKFGEDNRYLQSNSESNSINSSLATIKGISLNIAKDLYDIRGDYDSFLSLLYRIKQDKKRIHGNHIDLLIGIDYFSDYGNQNELRAICDMFDFFKDGKVKSVKKDTIPEPYMFEILNELATDVGKDGKILKAFKVSNCMEIMGRCEKYIMSQNMPDVDYHEKVVSKIKSLGYIMPTNKEEDRPMLYITKLFPIHRKKDGKFCGYNVYATSLGSGKQTRYTVWSTTEKKNGELKEQSVLKCLGYKKSGANFEITAYHIADNGKKVS